MERVLQPVCEAGFSSVTLWVLDTNSRARRFCEAIVWAPDAEKVDDERASRWPRCDISENSERPRSTKRGRLPGAHILEATEVPTAESRGQPAVKN